MLARFNSTNRPGTTARSAATSVACIGNAVSPPQIQAGSLASTDAPSSATLARRSVLFVASLGMASGAWERIRARAEDAEIGEPSGTAFIQGEADA